MAEKTASESIDERIAALGDWRGATLARVRAAVADPAMVVKVARRAGPVLFAVDMIGAASAM